MSRRVFLQSSTALLGGFALPAMLQSKPESSQWKTLQISPVAGFQYHRGEKLGYIPAIDNAAVSQLLDRGETMSALIVGLKKVIIRGNGLRWM